MPTLTVRNVPSEVIEALKELSARNHRSMQQEVLSLLESMVRDRHSALGQIEESWRRQKRRPQAREVDEWLRASRP